MSDANNTIPTPAPRFTPGPWTARTSLSAKLCEVRDGKGKPVVKWMGFDGNDRPILEDIGNTHIIASAPSLYAYAKADELLSKFEWAEIESEKGRVAKGEFESQLRSMGWDGQSSRLAFLQTYRAAALAQAEGRNP